MKQLIVNADDFGFTRDVNAGIVHAHRHGILTATTLMATGAAFDDAVNASTDDNWFLQRARLGLKITVTDWLHIYGQMQDSREINSDRADIPGLFGAEGDDTVDLRQAWVELGNPKNFPLTLKVGRQVLSYGDERLVGASVAVCRGSNKRGSCVLADFDQLHRHAFGRSTVVGVEDVGREPSGDFWCSFALDPIDQPQSCDVTDLVDRSGQLRCGVIGEPALE